jgi:hypothetical protein
MMTRVLVRCAAVTMVVLMMASCVRLGLSHRERPDAGAGTEAPAAQKTSKDYEDELRSLVTGQVEAAAKAGDSGRTQVIKRKPYFYKEYAVYPDGAADLKISMQEKESRSVPYIADVTVSKQRYATRLHRKRAEAERDTNLLRDTGADTGTYELRNGKWARVGGMFVATKSEENVNGEWLPVDETAKRTVASEEEKAKGGWFKRKWASITGKETEDKPAKQPKKNEQKGQPGGSQSMRRLQLQ